MNRSLPPLTAFLVGTLAVAGLAHDEHVAAEMSAAAVALDDVIPEEMAGVPLTLRYELDAPHRTLADFFPRAMGEQHGVQLGYLSLPGRRATHELLLTALSQEGYGMVNQVMSLEEVLRNLDAYAAVRVPDNYGVHLFGSPSPDGSWAWKFEGHHLSLNFTLSGGAVASAPIFLGASPLEVRNGPRTGLRTFTAPLEHARALVGEFDDAQRLVAVDAEPLTDDIVPRGGAITEADAPGLSAADMTDAQRSRLEALVTSFARLLRPELARAELDRIDAAGWERVRFRWRGGTDGSARCYVRVEGPTVLIELDCLPGPGADGDANHLHAIWHDPQGDYGRDLLSEHYEQQHGR